MKTYDEPDSVLDITASSIDNEQECARIVTLYRDLVATSATIRVVSDTPKTFSRFIHAVRQDIKNNG